MDIVKQFCPVKQCTFGKNFHFFGYYEKPQWDVSGKYLLGLEVPPIKRYMNYDDTATIGLIDLENQYKFIPLAATTAWNWQQGAALSWLDHFNDGNWITYNSRKHEGSGYEAILLNIKTREKRKLPTAIYNVTPNNRFGLSLNFKRLRYTHPTIGYAEPGGEPLRGDRSDEASAVARPPDHPSDDGLFRMDLQTGEIRLIVDLESTVKIGHHPSMDGAVHWFTHPVPSPSGHRVLFIHRYAREISKRHYWSYRLITASIEGGDICILDHSMSPLAFAALDPDIAEEAVIKDKHEHGFSHDLWLDDEHPMAWGHRLGGAHYHIYKDQSDEVSILGEDCLTENGHFSFCPLNPDWMVSDLYPDDENMQTLFLYKMSTGTRIDVARFYHDPEQIGHCRCDLHPRWSRDGRTICVDSTKNKERQMYLVDVSSITKL